MVRSVTELFARDRCGATGTPHHPKRSWATILWAGRVARFAVVGNYAFTQEQRDEYESVVAYDFETGKELWAHQDKTILSIVEANGASGPHATPQFDDGLLYSLGGTGILNCLVATTGKVFWSKNIMDDAGDGRTPAKSPEWGVSGSPLIVDNLVIVIPGGTPTEGAIGYNKGVAAYDKKSRTIGLGRLGKRPASYGSPRVETIADTRQVLVPNGSGLFPATLYLIDGRELWFSKLDNDPKVNSTMPWILDDGSLIFGTGYGVGTVRLDIKTNAGNKWEATRRWLSSNKIQAEIQ